MSSKSELNALNQSLTTQLAVAQATVENMQKKLDALSREKFKLAGALQKQPPGLPSSRRW